MKKRYKQEQYDMNNKFAKILIVDAKPLPTLAPDKASIPEKLDVIHALLTLTIVHNTCYQN